MKIAICVSGIPRSGVGAAENKNSNFKRTIAHLERNFPTGDVFIGTWNRFENVFTNHPFLAEYPHWTFDEPDAHYHPYFDMPKDIMISEKMKAVADIYRKKVPHLHERIRWQAHQILCHANLVNQLPEKYDIIIRARFDCFTYRHAKFEKYVDEAYKNKTTFGFATLGYDRPTFNIDRELLKTEAHQNDGAVAVHNCRQKYVFDSLIIHHRDHFDTERAFQLFDEKKLCPCEFGFYQMLGQPYNDNHRQISGWANADRHVLPKWLNEYQV